MRGQLAAETPWYHLQRNQRVRCVCVCEAVIHRQQEVPARSVLRRCAAVCCGVWLMMIEAERRRECVFLAGIIACSSDASGTDMRYCSPEGASLWRLCITHELDVAGSQGCGIAHTTYSGHGVHGWAAGLSRLGRRVRTGLSSAAPPAEQRERRGRGVRACVTRGA